MVGCQLRRYNLRTKQLQTSLVMAETLSDQLAPYFELTEAMFNQMPTAFVPICGFKTVTQISTN